MSHCKMASRFVLVILASFAAASALPTGLDPVIAKLDPEGLRYGYIRDDDGVPHLVDNWVKVSDLARNARYNPDTDNQYHLYTRANALVSQPLVHGNANILQASNFNPSKRTIILIHGFLGNILSGFNTVLVPAFLLAGDVNVIVVDWGAGAHWGLNGISSGRSVGRLIAWINSVSGASLNNYHVLGYSVGAHQAGIVGKTLLGHVDYISALDPADRWLNSQSIQSTDAVYTEVIHTNIGNIGMEEPRGDVDIYPNGGINMPGCATSTCDHYRSYFYFGETLATGGFTATQCNNLEEAKSQTCTSSNTIKMGGLLPKHGVKGIYSLATNASPPFSRG